MTFQDLPDKLLGAVYLLEVREGVLKASKLRSGNETW